jgi:hypothetical protein
LLIGVIVLTTGVAGFATGRAVFRPTARVPQPIAFNHEKHVEDLGLECDYCHEFYSEHEHSGLPKLTSCLECHEEAQTESLEEEKIRELAQAGEDDVFRKLFRMPDHTFYSHRRHVTIGKVECETCHGSIARTTAPPERPLLRVDMEFCIDCHEKLDQPVDCTSCHR